MIECPQIFNFMKPIFQLFIILFLYYWTSYLNLETVCINNLIEFFEDMLNTFDSSKGSWKKNYFPFFIININPINLNLTQSKTRTLHNCINFLLQFKLLNCSLCNYLHILTNRYDTLTSLKTVS